MKIFVGLVFLNSLLFGQSIFPNITGQELLDSLVANYKTNTVFSYDKARDTLFAKIYSINDSLRGVYTGYTIYLDPTQDPTTYAYNQNIDTEHTYPRSKGATGQAESDMHHLYPTRTFANSARGNNPFADIPDMDTDKWFRRDVILYTIPSMFIDEYSESDDDNLLFEPREDHKGNAARAVFYFYTMYKQQADNADPQFFSIQKNTLYQWHLADQVDSLEVIRNNKIALYQGGKQNPFILDSSLVRRAYFENPQSIMNEDYNIAGFELYQNYPNPFNPITNIRFQVADFGFVSLKLYDVMGREIDILVNEQKPPGEYRINWDGVDKSGKKVSSGIYIYEFRTDEFVKIKKMVLLK